jgi:hypothetical protein
VRSEFVDCGAFRIEIYVSIPDTETFASHKGSPFSPRRDSTETIWIREKSEPIRATLEIAAGPIRRFAAVSQERKQFLLDQGTNSDLIEPGLVLDVSDSLACQYKEESRAIASLAAQCGLNEGDLD